MNISILNSLIKNNLVLIVLLISHSPLKWSSHIILLMMVLLIYKRIVLQKIEILQLLFIVCIIFIGISINLIYNFNTIALFLGLYMYIPLLIIIFLYSNVSLQTIENNIMNFVKIEFVFVFFQYIILVYKYKAINIFSANKSAGDFIAGSFLSFSTTLAVSFSIIAFYFLYNIIILRKKQKKYFLLSSIIIFMTGAGVIIMPYVTSLAVFLTIVYSKKIFTFRFLFKVLPTFTLLIISFYFWQINNIKYFIYYLDLILNSAKVPFKLLLMDSVFSNDFLLGTGIGNFSSRASLFLSGQYLDNQLFFPIVPSEATKELIMLYYSKNNAGMNIFGYDGLSVVNEPFSQYTTMFSEFGLVGFLLFVTWLLSLIYYSIKIKNILLFIVIFFSLLIFIGNNWLEFVSYISLFFLVLKYSIIRSKNV